MFKGHLTLFAVAQNIYIIKMSERVTRLLYITVLEGENVKCKRDIWGNEGKE